MRSWPALPPTLASLMPPVRGLFPPTESRPEVGAEVPDRYAKAAALIQASFTVETPAEEQAESRPATASAPATGQATSALRSATQSTSQPASAPTPKPKVETHQLIIVRLGGDTFCWVPDRELQVVGKFPTSLYEKLIAELRDRKVWNIESVSPDLVAAGNIGCITQLEASIQIPIVHTVELLDWALGGPCPEELRPLEGRMKTMKSLLEEPAVAQTN